MADGGKGQLKEFGVVLYTLLYLKWITDKFLHGSLLDVMCRKLHVEMLCVHITHNVMCRNAGFNVRGEWIHIDVWPSPITVHVKLSQHCESAIFQYKTNS